MEKRLAKQGKRLKQHTTEQTLRDAEYTTKGRETE